MSKVNTTLFDACNIFDLELQDTVAHHGVGSCRVRRIASRGELEGRCNFIDVAVIPPGCSIGRHRHRVNEEELYLIVEGEGLMWRNGREQRVKAGDLLRTPAGGAHGLINDGDRDLRIFVFELATESATKEVVGLVLIREGRVLLEQRPETATCYAGRWDTPGGKLEPGEEPAEAMIREAREELGVELTALRELAVIDDKDLTSGRNFRHHVFTADVAGEIKPLLGQRLEWFAVRELEAIDRLSSIVLPSVRSRFE